MPCFTQLEVFLLVFDKQHMFIVENGENSS